MDKQQIKARFFGAHIGCQFLDWHNELTELTGIERHPGRDGRWDLHFFDEKNNFHGTCKDGLAECKLTLRPLSSITDAEAVDLFTMATGFYIAGIERSDDKIVGVGMGQGSGNIIIGGGNVAMWTKISPLPVGRFLETWNSQVGDAPECAEYLAIDYLRSINICVPFMGLDPIAEGWAILDEEFSENAQQEAKKEEKI